MCKTIYLWHHSRLQLYKNMWNIEIHWTNGFDQWGLRTLNKNQYGRQQFRW